MFWKRENKVQVELTSPITINCPTSATQEPQTPATTGGISSDRELKLKLLITIALAIQAFFFIIGYLGFTVRHEQYGIKTGELELTNSAILAEGYRQSLSYLTIGDNSSVIITLLHLLPFLIISALTTYLITDRNAPWPVFMNRGFAGWILSFLLFTLPVFGLLHSIEVTKEEIQHDTGINVNNGLSREYIISIKNGERLSGQLIAADTKTTFFLSKQTVYKVDNATGQIIRQILLKEDPVKASTEN
ncbi:hypothetical protein [Pseudomonas protegens]|uniref:hypothetical protein n=1 Tax=Pseudomonas protegens TaxID=380021 RepID=UPI00107242C6|nr:hypothetical protein [Pseudomonas protegens]